jgi:hypothetical protein
MPELATFVNIASISMVCAAGVKNWLLARGVLRPVYWLMIAVGLVNVALTISIVVLMPMVWGQLSFIAMAVWQMIMGIIGLRRLNGQR